MTTLRGIQMILEIREQDGYRFSIYAGTHWTSAGLPASSYDAVSVTMTLIEPEPPLPHTAWKEPEITYRTLQSITSRAARWLRSLGHYEDAPTPRHSLAPKSYQFRRWVWDAEAVERYAQRAIRVLLWRERRGITLWRDNSGEWHPIRRGELDTWMVVNYGPRQAYRRDVDAVWLLDDHDEQIGAEPVLRLVTSTSD